MTPHPNLKRHLQYLGSFFLLSLLGPCHSDYVSAQQAHSLLQQDPALWLDDVLPSYFEQPGLMLASSGIYPSPKLRRKIV